MVNFIDTLLFFIYERGRGISITMDEIIILGTQDITVDYNIECFLKGRTPDEQ